MSFANPEAFFLLLLLIPIILWHFLIRHKDEPTMLTASAEPYRHSPRTLRTQMLHLPFILRILTFIMLVVVLARPMTQNSLTERDTEGIDIMIAMDISTSMLATDLQPNRIEAAKQVAFSFISNRPDDNIGLTLFGGEAFTGCPLTTDHASLLSIFRGVSCNLQKNGTLSSGTAIGMGLINAVSHLENSKAKSKVIILLTDGVNNAGDISPLMAAEEAKKRNVRIYTISVGKQGRSRQAVAQLPNGELYEADVDNTYDPATLKQIASTTGGIFYQAESKERLKDIYDDIDKLEKTKLKVMNYERRYEAYQPFGIAALLLLFLDVLLRITWFRRVP